MSVQSGFSGRWQKVRRATGRIPLRIKLISAVLALVVIALGAISIAGISVLRNYLLNGADGLLATTQFQATHVVEGYLADPGAYPQPGLSQISVDWQSANGQVNHVQLPVQTRFGMRFQPRIIPGPAIPPGQQWPP